MERKNEKNKKIFDIMINIYVKNPINKKKNNT